MKVERDTLTNHWELDIQIIFLKKKEIIISSFFISFSNLEFK